MDTLYTVRFRGVSGLSSFKNFKNQPTGCGDIVYYPVGYFILSHPVGEVALWRNGRASDLRSRGREFDARSGRGCVTTLGKLFTPNCLDAGCWHSSLVYRVVKLGTFRLPLPLHSLSCDLTTTFFWYSFAVRWSHRQQIDIADCSCPKSISSICTTTTFTDQKLDSTFCSNLYSLRQINCS